MRAGTKKIIAKQRALSWARPLAPLLVTFLVCMVMLCLNTMAANHQEKKLEAIRSSLAYLEQKKSVLIAKKERMYEEIASRGDPAWIEVVLMKKLGFVPKGQKKVLFEGSN